MHANTQPFVDGNSHWCPPPPPAGAAIFCPTTRHLRCTHTHTCTYTQVTTSFLCIFSIFPHLVFHSQTHETCQHASLQLNAGLSPRVTMRKYLPSNCSQGNGGEKKDGCFCVEEICCLSTLCKDTMCLFINRLWGLIEFMLYFRNQYFFAFCIMEQKEK